MRKSRIHCIYRNCRQGCISVSQHRALYASFTRKQKNIYITSKPSTKINWNKVRELEKVGFFIIKQKLKKKKEK